MQLNAMGCPIGAGAHMIVPLPGSIPLKPGSATLPFFGVEPAVLNDKGEELEGECEG